MGIDPGPKIFIPCIPSGKNERALMACLPGTPPAAHAVRRDPRGCRAGFWRLRAA
jgi:hypothetical protein